MYIFTHIQNIFLSADMHLYKGVWLSYLFMNLSVRLCVCASIFPSLVPIWLICFGSINVLISTATAWPVLAYWLLFMNKLLPWKSLWVFYVLVFHHYGCMKLACPGRFFFKFAGFDVMKIFEKASQLSGSSLTSFGTPNRTMGDLISTTSHGEFLFV